MSGSNGKGRQMKRLLAVLTVCFSTLLAYQGYSVAQQRTTPQLTPAEEKRLQDQTQNAVNNINRNRELRARVAALAQKKDTAGIQKLLIENGAPDSLGTTAVALSGARLKSGVYRCWYETNILGQLTIRCMLCVPLRRCSNWRSDRDN